MFDGVPYGVNMSATVYNGCKHWYDISQTDTGCSGFMTRLGKQVLVTFGHLINALLITPIMAIYDLVMATFFLLANLCTGFSNDELRERLSGHLYSMVSASYEILRNLMAALWPPMAYRGDDAVNMSFVTNHTGAVMDRMPGAVFQGMRQMMRGVNDMQDFNPEGIMRCLVPPSLLEMANPDAQNEIFQRSMEFFMNNGGPEAIEDTVSRTAQRQIRTAASGTDFGSMFAQARGQLTNVPGLSSLLGH